MEQQNKYEVIKNLVDSDGNKKRAALKLGVTVRQVNRLIKKYKKDGKEAFVHGNTGRKPATTISEEIKNNVIDLYQTKYNGANFTHYTELLEELEGISISVTAVTSILESKYIISPKTTKAKKRRLIKSLEEQKEKATSQKETDKIQSNIVALEDAHPSRPRVANFGELIQMDASSYEWFGGLVTNLHVAVDDSTGAIVGAYFDDEETLNGYYHVLYQILTTYGIPYKFLTDKRTVFTYKRKNSPSLDEDTYTQFSYACKQLGISIESTSVAQAKGRVERLNGTLQSRLPVELRLAGVTTIQAANEFLNSYIKKFNAKFALPVNNTKNVFETQPSDEKINLILAVITSRTIDSGHCIQFNKKKYRLLDASGELICYKKSTNAMLIKSFDGRLFCCVNDKDMYSLEEVPEKQEKSQNFDSDYVKSEQRKQYIPDMSHPWRKSAVISHARSLEHHWDDDVSTILGGNADIISQIQSNGFVYGQQI